jgi:hypothetical protein
LACFSLSESGDYITLHYVLQYANAPTEATPQDFARHNGAGSPCPSPRGMGCLLQSIATPRAQGLRHIAASHGCLGCLSSTALVRKALERAVLGAARLSWHGYNSGGFRVVSRGFDIIDRNRPYTWGAEGSATRKDGPSPQAPGPRWGGTLLARSSVARGPLRGYRRALSACESTNAGSAKVFFHGVWNCEMCSELTVTDHPAPPRPL